MSDPSQGSVLNTAHSGPMHVGNGSMMEGPSGGMYGGVPTVGQINNNPSQAQHPHQQHAPQQTNSVLDGTEAAAPPRPKRMRSETKVKFGGAFPECCKMINSLLNNKQAKPFEHPVDPLALNIPDYPTLIPQPMDLTTIQGKLNHGEYYDADEFADDVRLVWNNCEKYNGPDHAITVMANNLRKIFEKAFAQLKTKVFEELPEGHPMMNTKGSKPPKKSSRYDNNSPHSRPEMTYEEKRLLCTHINHLDTKYLGKVIQIINRSLPNILDSKDPGEEEVEISVESLSAAALRELEDYVKEVKHLQP